MSQFRCFNKTSEATIDEDGNRAKCMAELEGKGPANECIENGADRSTFEIWDLGILAVTGEKVVSTCITLLYPCSSLCHISISDLLGARLNARLWQTRTQR